MSSLKEAINDIANRSVGPALALSSFDRQVYVQGINYQMWLVGMCLPSVDLIDPNVSYNQVADLAIELANTVIRKLAEIEIRESQRESS